MNDKPGDALPYRLGMLKAASMLDCTNQDILLASGEIDAQGLRDVRAVLAWKKRQIEMESENGNGHGF